MAKKGKDIDHPIATGTDTPNGASNPEHDSIAALAHQLWLARGCPHGSDQDDWYLAESMLKSANGK